MPPTSTIQRGLTRGFARVVADLPDSLAKTGRFVKDTSVDVSFVARTPLFDVMKAPTSPTWRG